VAIICACLPAFRSLLVRICPCLNLGVTRKGSTHKADFVEGNRELGFGTVSRSVAEKTYSMHLPVVPGAIAMHRTYHVERSEPRRGRPSDATSERDLVNLPPLEEFNSSDSTLASR
jgi:hypothetical protein